MCTELTHFAAWDHCYIMFSSQGPCRKIDTQFALQCSCTVIPFLFACAFKINKKPLRFWGVSSLLLRQKLTVNDANVYYHTSVPLDILESLESYGWGVDSKVSLSWMSAGYLERVGREEEGNFCSI